MFDYTESEKTESGNRYRREYVASLNTLIESLQKKAEENRAGTLLKIKNSPEKYREIMREMLGWPLTVRESSSPECKKEFVFSERGINAYRMQFDILGCVKFYGIYFEKVGKKNLPLVICQHGGLGSPEFCSGMYDTTANYNEMTERVLKYGVNVFAPQMLLWEDEYEVPFNRQETDAKLKQVGSSVAAVELYSLMRCIDYLSTLDTVNKDKIGMVGLSYGGFYTLFTTALDTRIKAALSCSFYNNRCEYSWSDWVWFDAANKMLDNEIAMLIYPRPLCIAVGSEDKLFAADFAKAEYEKLANVYDKDKLDFIVFDGTHEFCKSDEYIEKVVNILENI